LQLSLRTYTTTEFYKEARRMAVLWNLKLPDTNAYPVTQKDFVKALGGLEQSLDGSMESETKVYMVCHNFHHDRSWVADIVDEWSKKNNITILYPSTRPAEGGKRMRNIVVYRGGFGTFARIVKIELVKTMMRLMLKEAGWSISLKNNAKQVKNGKKFEKIVIKVIQTCTSYVCYRVTQDAPHHSSEQSKNAAAQTDSTVSFCDLLHWGAYFAGDLGVVKTETEVQESWDRFKSSTGVVGQQIVTGGRTVGGDVSEITISASTTAALPQLPGVSNASSAVPLAFNQQQHTQELSITTTAHFFQPPEESITAAHFKPAMPAATGVNNTVALKQPPQQLVSTTVAPKQPRQPPSVAQQDAQLPPQQNPASTITAVAQENQPAQQPAGAVSTTVVQELQRTPHHTSTSTPPAVVQQVQPEDYMKTNVAQEEQQSQTVSTVTTARKKVSKKPKASIFQFIFKCLCINLSSNMNSHSSHHLMANAG
jgi:hypothetical protein